MSLLFCCAVTGRTAPAATVWASDLPSAQLKARSEGKSVLVHFSGSDWCGWCIKLRKEVFSKPMFESYARSNLILVRVDFPRRQPQPVSVQRANQQLAQMYQVNAYPTIILLDAQGGRLGSVSYGQGGARTFIAEVEKIIHPRQDAPLPGPVSHPKQSPRTARTSPQPSGKSAAEELTLQRITGPRKNRRALINNHTLGRGETATLPSPSGPMKVRCVEIRERSVIVTLDGGRERRELRVGRGT